MTVNLVRPFVLAVVSVAASIAAAAEFDAVHVERIIPFENEDAIDPEVLGCELGAELSANLRPYARDRRIAVTRSDNALTAEQNYVAIMIKEVINDGGPIRGHDKFGSAFAELYIDGQSIAWTIVERSSGGGFGGVVRRSCGVHRRIMERLAADIAAWLDSLRS